MPSLGPILTLKSDFKKSMVSRFLFILQRRFEKLSTTLFHIGKITETDVSVVQSFQTEALQFILIRQISLKISYSLERRILFSK